MSKIQRQNIKTEAELITDGATVSSLPGDDQVYVQANSINKTLRDAITDGDIGGGGSGLKNYIANPTAEEDTAGWTVYANTTAGDAPDDFGGTATGNLTFTRNTTTPLTSPADFELAVTTANLQGEGVYYEFTLDRVDLAKVLTGVIRKDASDSNISDGDYKYYIVSSSDSFVSDFNVIRVSGEDLSGSTNDNIFQFQADASDLDYRFCIHRATTRTDASSLFLDELSIGPRETKVGSFREVRVRAEGNLGQSLTAGASGVPYNTVLEDTTGSWSNDTFTSPEAGNYLFEGSAELSASVSPDFQWYINGILQKRLVTQISSGIHAYSFSVFLEKGDQLQIRPNTNITVASGGIAHWVNIQKLDLPETDAGIAGRDIRVVGRGNSGAAITALTERIDWTITDDSTGSMSNVSGNGLDTFTAPEKGDYIFNGLVAQTSNLANRVFTYLNNTLYQQNIDYQTFPGNDHIPFTATVPMEKGDTVDFRFAVTATLDNQAIDHHIMIKKFSTPQTLLGQETIAARAIQTSGQSIPNSAVTQVLLDSTTTFDTHGSFSSNQFTAPKSGYYQVNAQIYWTSLSSGVLGILFLYKNGSQYSRNLVQGAGTNSMPQVSDLVFLEKGDTLDIRAFQNSGGARNLDTSDNFFSVTKIG